MISLSRFCRVWTGQKNGLVNQITSSVVPAITQGPVSPIHQGVGTKARVGDKAKCRRRRYVIAVIKSYHHSQRTFICVLIGSPILRW